MAIEIYHMNQKKAYFWMVVIALLLSLQSSLPFLLFAHEISDDQDKIEIEPKVIQQLKELTIDKKVRLLAEYSEKYAETVPARSLAYIRYALELSEHDTNIKARIFCLQQMGDWHLNSFDYQEAARYYQEALKFAFQIRHKRYIAVLTVNVGIINQTIEEYDKARENFSHGLQMMKDAGFTDLEQSYVINNLGILAYDTGNYKEALNYHQRVLTTFNKNNNKRGMAAAHLNVARDFDKLGEYEQALKHYNLALPIYKEIGYKWGEANAYLSIGTLYFHMNRPDDALKMLNISLEQSTKLNAKDIIQEYYSVSADLFEASGDYKLALAHSKKAAELKRELVDETKKKQISRMSAKYEIERKDNEIRMLRKNNQMARMWGIFLTVGFCLFVAILIVLYSRYRTKKRANELLLASEDKYKSLYSQAGDAIFLIDNYRFIDCNEKALKMFNVTREWLINKSYSDISPQMQPDGNISADVVTGYMKKALEGQPQRFYWKHTNSQGAELDTVASLTAVAIHRQQLIQAIIHDISDRQRLEDERIKSGKLEAIRQLSGGIAHDLNNLLAVLVGNLELAICDIEPDHPVKKQLKRMEHVVQSANKLSEKFITFAEGGFDDRQAIELHHLIESALKERLPQDAGITSYLQIPDDLWKVRGDSQQIRRVFVNLTKNAAQALKKTPEPKIDISAQNITLNADDVFPLKPGNYISVTFKDNGEGIASKNLTRIFDPYFTTRDEYNRKGLGMGLALSQSIIKRHDGVIQVISQPGKGTQFKIYLPASDSPRK